VLPFTRDVGVEFSNQVGTQDRTSAATTRFQGQKAFKTSRCGKLSYTFETREAVGLEPTTVFVPQLFKVQCPHRPGDFRNTVIKRQ